MDRLPRGIVTGAVAALLGLGFCFTALAAEEGEHRLTVVYNPPGLSVEARGVSLLRVLQEIGTSAGFTVDDYGASPMVSNFSVKDGSVETVLRQLLAGENYAVVYRGKGDREPEHGIDRILLLSPKTYVRAVPASGSGRRERERGSGEDILQAQRKLTRSLASSPSAQPSSSSGVGVQGKRMGSGIVAGSSPVASTRFPPVPSGLTAPQPSTPAASQNPGPGVPVGLQHRAMQNVRNLVDALDRATQDLQRGHSNR